METWFGNTKDFSNDKVCKLLVATKSDSIDRAVSYEEGRKLADSYGIKFIETSARDNINVTEAFETIAQDVFGMLKSKYDEFDSAKRIRLRNEKEEKTGCISKMCG